jgi:potassium-transporting ATPase KdpC subunit
MIRNLTRAILFTLVLAVLTGIVYPLVMTGFAQVAFRSKADGSVVTVNGREVGSAFVGQQWKGPQWFYGRPSVIDYDASTSQGSNLGPLSKALATDIEQRAKAIIALEGPYHPGLTTAQIPVDLLTASASGLDPQISPAAARFQAPRIAAARGIPLSEVMRLIDENTSGRTLGFLGEPRVNVLELNLALQRLAES